MEKSIENGYDEINVFVRRTRQIKEFEPLVVGATVKRMVKSEDKNREINNLLIDIEEEVNFFLGIEEKWNYYYGDCFLL